MTVLRQVLLAAALAAAGVGFAQAGDTINGRWALDPASCNRYFGGTAKEQPLIVTDTAVRWSNDACRIERVYKTGDTVHIQALCWGESGERSVPVSLRPHGDKLEVHWDRKASGDMKRCL